LAIHIHSLIALIHNHKNKNLFTGLDRFARNDKLFKTLSFNQSKKICSEKIVQQSGSLKSLKSFPSLYLCLHSGLPLTSLTGKSVEVGFFISFLQ